jgi:hypothetical protein
MMSGNRRDYASASEWLSALRQDEAWLSQQQRLQTSAATDVSIHRDDAIRRIGHGETFEFWEIYGHQVEPVISEVWEIAELSLPKLKIQAIGMLSMEWIEREQKGVIDNRKEIVVKLKPIFYNDEAEANSFLSDIQHMKGKQITERVNQLVRARQISEISRKRELWSVLHEYGLYDKSESNWNSQVN